MKWRLKNQMLKVEKMRGRFNLFIKKNEKIKYFFKI